GEMVSSTVVADNLMMALYFIILMLIPSLTFFRKRFTHPHVLEVEQQNVNGEGNSTLAESYWKRNNISLKDIAMSVGTAFLLVIISFKIAGFLGELIPSGEDVSFALNLVNDLFGENYLVITTITFTVLALFF